MKKHIFIYIFIATLIVSCNNYLDVNTDPNRPTSVTPELMLPVAQNYTARWMKTDRRVNHLGNMIMYNWSESAGFSWYNDEFQYLANSTTFYDELFDDAYADALKQYSLIASQDPATLGVYVASANIMMAYTYQILVDLYGDIPYSDALQRGTNPTPAYDDAEDVYAGLLVQLTDAITMLEDAEANELTVYPSDDDTIFGGDTEAWKQFANSIKLRILTRANGVMSSTDVSSELAAIVTQGSGYISADVMVNPGYINEDDKQNPQWEDFGEDSGGSETLSGQATCATDYIINLLQNTNDTRIDYIYEIPLSGSHNGVPQGITSSADAGQGPDDVSNIGPGVMAGYDMGATIFTVAENYFNQAELALNGFGGDPQTLYESGVQASFTSLGAGSATAYYGQSIDNVGYAFSSDKLEAIITQKWLAVNGITAEQSWFDLSRTGFPSGLPVSLEKSGLVRPVRLSYPASEVGTNAVNVPTSPNAFSSTIFWAN
ncbi:MAG: SusD/RagB family nutrient-binding outer membrane lipoprotein [Cytophagales bacterium]|nr:SusD/RagB family nutrient-binding outer membrane lipoprotein [Cytophagales bacterium]